MRCRRSGAAFLGAVVGSVALLAVLLLSAPNAAVAAPKNSAGQGEAAAKSKEAGAKEKDEGAKTGLKNVLGDSKGEGGPVLIKSDSLNLNAKDRLFIYQGNVEVVRDDLTITAQTVEGRYDDQNRIKTILCKTNVVITKGDGLRATSNRALYKVDAAKIELTENPEVINKGNALAADKITVFIDEDRSEAEGNVRVKVLKPDESGTMLGR